MTKLNQKKRNKTKPDIFLWDILKSAVMPFLIKNIKVFQ